MVKQIVSNLKYPMLTFLFVGLVAGLIISVMTSRNADKVISEYKELNKLVLLEYKEKIERQKSSIESLSEENSSLKKNVKIVEITKPVQPVEPKPIRRTDPRNRGLNRA